MTEQEYRDNLAAHALGALDENERRELDAALAEDAKYCADFDALRETAAALSFAVEPLEQLARLVNPEIPDQ